jgi:superfamily II DNA or RNA helicase
MYKQLKIKPYYNSKDDDVLKEFYEPLLSETKKYNRVSAFFDSNIIKFYSKGIEKIVKSKGKINFIFSKQLNHEDYELIQQGYKEREDYLSKVSEDLILTDSKEVSNLAYLIRIGIVDIKIAFTKEGIFHDKFGLMYDEYGDCLYFRGSNNETVASVKKNFEGFEVSVKNNSELNEKAKILQAEEVFEKLWSNRFKDVSVIDFPEAIMNKIISFDKGKIINNETELKKEYLLLNLTEDFKLVGEVFFDLKKFDVEKGYYRTYIQSYVNKLEKNYIYFENTQNYLILKELILRIKKFGAQQTFEVEISDRLISYLNSLDLHIEKRRALGIAIKNKHESINDNYSNFSKIVNSRMQRRLRDPQMLSAYHISKMIRSANFSVPGSGKTSMVYGAFAYLSSQEIDEVNKIVVVGPLSSFAVWKEEFLLNFGPKIILNYFDITEYNDKKISLKYESKNKNLILINYEILNSLSEELIKQVDEKTLLVFDEVHKVKAINGMRATAALKIAKNAKYRTVLSGTPIPNSYLDVHNMLNLLFTDEYDYFFNFSQSYLEYAHESENSKKIINERIFPFYMRTTKKELNVPDANLEDIESGYVEMNDEEIKLFNLIYKNLKNDYFSLYIRLLQASSNPELLLKKIDLVDLEIFDEANILEKNSVIVDPLNFDRNQLEMIKYKKSRKFIKGIEIVKKLVSEGKQVVVWGIFIDTLVKISRELSDNGISNGLIYGNVDLEEREDIINRFKKEDLKVIIANPNTLAESVSLHKNCHNAVYFEYSFNLTHYLQSKDRIHRLGLHEDAITNYFILILNSNKSIFNSIDLKVFNRLKEKEKTMLSAVEGTSLDVEKDSIKDDVMQLLGIY